MAQPQQVPLRQPGKADWKCALQVAAELRKHLELVCAKEQGNLETVRRLVALELVHECLELPPDLYA